MKNCRGFTLMELLIALAIFAILSVMAYGGLSVLLDTRMRTEEQSARLARLQTAMVLISRDLGQASNRTIRDQFGDIKPAMTGAGEGEGELEMTRSGWRNPAGVVRSNLQRVGYTIEDEQLMRSTWRVLDRAQDTEPLKAVLLEGIRAFNLRFLDGEGSWEDQWPPFDPDNKTLDALPRAVEITLDTEAWGEITRLILVPG